MCTDIYRLRDWSRGGYKHDWPILEYYYYYCYLFPFQRDLINPWHANNNNFPSHGPLRPSTTCPLDIDIFFNSLFVKGIYKLFVYSLRIVFNNSAVINFHSH